ncbi:MAG: hypothetical protein WC273_06895 [Dehalococcoidia bacterium]
MSLLSAIFGAATPTFRARRRKAPARECVGHRLMPRWRGPDVMDDDTKAMGFVCHVCGREYLPAEVTERHLIREAGR